MNFDHHHHHRVGNIDEGFRQGQVVTHSRLSYQFMACQENETYIHNNESSLFDGELHETTTTTSKSTALCRPRHTRRVCTIRLGLVFLLVIMSFAAAAALRYSARGLATRGMAAKTTTTIQPVVTELTLTCADGVQLAAQQWTLPSAASSASSSDSDQQTIDLPPWNKRRNILCLHGWMDNCASFQRFAPRLLEQLQHDESQYDQNTTTTLVALDLPGHGRSSHRSVDGPPTVLAESVFYVAEALRLLNWTGRAVGSGSSHCHGEPAPVDDDPTTHHKVSLIGHSMGAAVSSIYAAAFGHHVDQLVLLEGAAPLPRRSEDAIHHVRAHVQRRQAALLSNKPHRRVYPDLQTAIDTRCKTATKFPGQQYLSQEAARDLVLRGSTTQPVDGGGTGGNGVVFTHDPRLQWPTIQYWTHDMNRALYESMQATPTCLLLAEDGWPRSDDDLQSPRDLMRPQVMATLPGSHHFHADPDTADAVVAHVAAFLSGRDVLQENDETVDSSATGALSAL